MLAQDIILNQLAEGVIVTDAGGKILLVNQAAAALHGVARLDVAPTAYSRTYHLYTEDGLRYPPLDLPLARAVRGETVHGARWRIRRPDGTEVLAIGNAQPIRASDGTQKGAVLTLRDDTARDAAESALRDFNLRLAELVQGRTLEAETARAEAERASSAKSDFLACMSHEIRTPLNSVIGYAELLAAITPEATTSSRYVERIRAAGAALLTIVNDVLDFASVEAGRIELNNTAFCVHDLFEEAVMLVESDASKAGLDLRVELSPDLPRYVYGDRNRLRQVVLNLLNNAVKFTCEGAIVLSVELRAPLDGSAALRVAVRDTGIGIAAEKQKLLFQRFSQIDPSYQRGRGGSGLGLAISQRLVSLMDGTMGVDSAEGEGSTFWFDVQLPVARDLEEYQAQAPFGSISARRVLVVDDLVANQELVSVVLGTVGHEVEVVADGAAAVDAVRRGAFDLVLMDVQMPGMDGLTATRRIRALEHHCASIPIVGMTANVLPHQVQEVLHAGMDDHVGKPFDCRELLTAIDRWTKPTAAGTASAIAN